MVAAFLNGFIGLGLSLGIGIGYLGMSWQEVLLCVLASNIAAIASLLFTLRAERHAWMSKIGGNRMFKTWSLLAIVFFTILLCLSPILRNFRNIAWMFMPLILSVGFGLPIFGPIQDQFVRRQQRQSLKN